MNFSKNGEIFLEYSLISEFCKAVSYVEDSKFVYIRTRDSFVDIYSEGSSSTAYLSVPLDEYVDQNLHAGLSKDRFLSLFKKLYSGQLSLLFSNSRITVSLGNINAKLPVVSPKSSYTAPTVLTEIDQKEVVQELVSGFSTCTFVDEDKKSEKKFPGILFDTSKYTRICKFTSRSLSLSVSEPVFQTSYRVCVSDSFAKAVRSFRKDISSIGFTDRHSTISLKNGTVVYFTLMYDSYPSEYINMWGFSDSYNLIPDGSISHLFDRDALLNAVDLVGSTLGDTEHWISLQTVGLSDNEIVWLISGKSFENVEVSEHVLSKGSEIVDKFAVNKRTLTMMLGMFEGQVALCNFNESFTVLSNESGSLVSVVLKSAR